MKLYDVHLTIEGLHPENVLRDRLERCLPGPSRLVIHDWQRRPAPEETVDVARAVQQSIEDAIGEEG